jgi:hypothetical protein
MGKIYLKKTYKRKGQKQLGLQVMSARLTHLLRPTQLGSYLFIFASEAADMSFTLNFFEKKIR